jgi:hypothetical protein
MNIKKLKSLYIYNLKLFRSYTFYIVYFMFKYYKNTDYEKGAP